MRDVKFTATRAELSSIKGIAERATACGHTIGPTMPLMMDLDACHSNGCPMDFAKLLDADRVTFAHDIYGITRHMDRDTGQLGGCFRPRCALPEGTPPLARALTDQEHADLNDTTKGSDPVPAGLAKDNRTGETVIDPTLAS